MNKPRTNQERFAQILLATASEPDSDVVLPPTKWWGTEIKALDPVTGELKTYCGPNVPGFFRQMAEQYCQKNGLGYCKVLDELVAEIPCKPNSYTPDFDNMVDYEEPTLN
ncbi:hypothetical protein Q5H92_14575 [Hymenobacter sp. M29]|uniref:Uncharacterized protein n=1 Tax=Hymenobacter mellowenesis TaxID=3063995 RepID=A0ABT9ADV0_9BACT|nr:hypothetical protein [Hymenobacter sp. M29]MDO7847592.1 hypothetical protein [Hymenobacter sp. M29]